MGEKLGKPLFETVGRPRVNPKRLPELIKTPEKVEEKEAVPVSPVRVSLLERISEITGLTPRQVADIVLRMVDQIEKVLNPNPGNYNLTKPASNNDEDEIEGIRGFPETKGFP